MKLFGGYDKTHYLCSAFINIITMRASYGIERASEIISIKFLAEESGVHRTYISEGITHTMVGGKPYYYSKEQVEKLNIAIGRIAGMLKRTNIALDDDVLLHIKAMTKCVKAKFIFEDVMSKSRSWYQNRVTSPKLRFKQEDIDELNRAVHEAGVRLDDIHLEYEEPPLQFAALQDTSAYEDELALTEMQM